MIDEVLEMLGELSTPGFFITAECANTASDFPTGLAAFALAKLARIHAGVSGRKFVYKENGWRIILTFFPTDRVVDERYAMKNRLIL